ncbi:hypothetical protein GORHZ_213_00010, partial [Gordonia rhizosphera NBRC 16068]
GRVADHVWECMGSGILGVRPQDADRTCSRVPACKAATTPDLMTERLVGAAELDANEIEIGESFRGVRRGGGGRGTGWGDVRVR